MRPLARRAGAPAGAPGRARQGTGAGGARADERHLALVNRGAGEGTEPGRPASPPRPLGAALLVLSLGSLALAAAAATALAVLAVPGAPGS